MTITTERRRPRYRRYSDRRVALILELHEILFEDPQAEVRDTLLLDAIRFDYDTNLAAFIDLPASGDGPLKVRSVSTDAETISRGSALTGEGLTGLQAAHEHALGAITLTRFRRPSLFDEDQWESLWNGDLGTPATALLSVAIKPERAGHGFMWLLLQGASKEWSSHDRELAEEIAHLVARVADKSAGQK